LGVEFPLFLGYLNGILEKFWKKEMYLDVIGMQKDYVFQGK
jgi:hypothetical protein